MPSYQSAQQPTWAWHSGWLRPRWWAREWTCGSLPSQVSYTSGQAVICEWGLSATAVRQAQLPSRSCLAMACSPLPWTVDARHLLDSLGCTTWLGCTHDGGCPPALHSAKQLQPSVPAGPLSPPVHPATPLAPCPELQVPATACLWTGHLSAMNSSQSTQGC